MKIRVFYANAKDDPGIDAACSFLARFLTIHYAGHDLSVTSGRDAHTLRFAACGRNWDRWAAETGAGSDVDGEPSHHLYIVPEGPIGRGTASILAAALGARRPVLRWNGRTDLDVSFAVVSRIVPTGERWANVAILEIVPPAAGEVKP